MWNTIGHDKAINVLRRSIDQGRMSHVYLLVGPRHVGKMTLALDLARAANCLQDEKPCGECVQCDRITRGLHADVRLVGVGSGETGNGRGKVNIGIGQVREIQREANLKPFEGRCRVFIFDGSEHLSGEAANSLLKTLEEPPNQVLLVLLASHREALLSTISSRCQTLELRPVPQPLIVSYLETRYRVDSVTANEIARLSDGRPGWAIEAAIQPEMRQKITEKLNDIEEVVGGSLEERFAYAAGLASAFGRDRDLARQELTLWLEWWRDVMLIKEDALQSVKHLSRTEKLKAVADSLSSAQVVRTINAVRETIDLLESNVNSRLALEHLMLSLP